MKLWTIGHSTRPINDFVSLLRQHGVEAIADVRRYPVSRKYPQYNRDALEATLAAAQIKYFWFEALGGRRQPRPDSQNTAWRNESFRGYADFMETPEFRAALEELLALARDVPTALMCAEAVWWRCHRGLIADVLKVRGIGVVHILGEDKAEEHPFTAAASLIDGTLSYASAAPRESAVSFNHGQ